MYTSAVIGLGNIGFRFSLDPLRKGVWSHVAAYEKSGYTRLAGAVEIDPGTVRLFKERHKKVPVFGSVSELMRKTSPEIVSICTPTATHYPILKELSRSGVKAVFCEKPVASSLREAREMVNLCRKKGILLAVNHTRRWESGYLAAKKAIDGGRIGKVTAVNCLYPAQVFNIGTHLFDIVRFLISADPETVSGVSFDPGKQDPGVSGWMIFNGKIPCTINVLNKRENLVFEVDIIGDKGRVKITENGGKLDLSVFRKSRRYSGYMELTPAPARPLPRKDRFIEAVDDIAKVLMHRKRSVNCSGEDGLIALSMSQALLASASNGSRPVSIKF
ncbi:MAG: Gfo/Idh/MocA family oxidoreductase [Candidatus Omnitrophica bacterium]|nr:Gfo/Idh/MocA family oxidoreductase [Candidatus Omnitrophota bacterium]MDD5310560.1 Gfo/Idh/MocA family oxidoreductase [Candidatus Omnitrophota bacterium]MDD5546014.1 Gfo/Idh/MocA family oxidoreductase [Candidatus Omnitrophota bacterium]